jgi:hypothetical protein
MATDEECMAYACECVRLAGPTDEPEIRDQLFALARNWMAAAMQERYKDAVTLKPTSPEPSTRLRPP